MLYVLAPSHLHEEYTSQLSSDEYKELFDGMLIDPFRGIPNWSSFIPEMLQTQHDKGNKLVWMVIDWKANNMDYNSIKESNDPLMRVPTLGYAGNVDFNLIGPEYMKFLGEHSMRIIDDIIARFPDIKLVFWCLYMRSRANVSSYPQEVQYNAIREKYKNNIIDIDDFTTPEEFRNNVCDRGGHPNKEGYKVMSRVLKAAL